MDDSAIASGLRSGDPAAWRALYDAYAERVWRCVGRLIGPHPADVADAVQETMMAAARSARNYDASKGSLWQWLWGITRVQVQLHFRKRARHERWKELPFATSETSGSPDALEAAELTEAVRIALNELPGDYGALLTAKYLDGESVEAIAGRERLTETAVRSKLARARDAFKRAFKQKTRIAP